MPRDSLLRGGAGHHWMTGIPALSKLTGCECTARNCVFAPEWLRNGIHVASQKLVPRHTSFFSLGGPAERMFAGRTIGGATRETSYLYITRSSRMAQFQLQRQKGRAVPLHSSQCCLVRDHSPTQCPQHPRYTLPSEERIFFAPTPTAMTLC